MLSKARFLLASSLAYLAFVGLAFAQPSQQPPRPWDASITEQQWATRFGDDLIDQALRHATMADFERAGAEGDLNGLVLAGLAHYWGRGAPSNLHMAREYFHQACNGGNGRGCYHLAEMSRLGVGARRNLRFAFPYYQQSCDAGFALGCNSLGIRYHLAEGVAQNWTQAAVSYQRACELGYASGCNNAGNRYANGEGVEQDWSQAAAYFELACRGDVASACLRLGQQHENGQHSPEAMGYFHLACENGDAEGCNRLGMGYMFGNGVEQNWSEAIRHFQLSCQGEYEHGCTNLVAVQERYADAIAAQARADEEARIDDILESTWPPALRASRLEALCEEGSEVACERHRENETPPPPPSNIIDWGDGASNSDAGASAAQEDDLVLYLEDTDPAVFAPGAPVPRYVPNVNCNSEWAPTFSYTFFRGQTPSIHRTEFPVGSPRSQRNRNRFLIISDIGYNNPRQTGQHENRLLYAYNVNRWGLEHAFPNTCYDSLEDARRHRAEIVRYFQTRGDEGGFQPYQIIEIDIDWPREVAPEE